MGMKSQGTISIELTEEGGMIARYKEPVLRVREIPPRPGIMMEPAVQAMIVGILESLDNDSDAEWKEDSRNKRLDRIKRMIENMNKGGNETKRVEEYYYEVRTLVCKDPKDLLGAVEKARAAWESAKELERSGKQIWESPMAFQPVIGRMAAQPPGDMGVIGETECI